MSLLNNVYLNSLAENERNLLFWKDYLKNLNSLDFNIYSDRLKVPILVPIGSRIFFKGELQHTNEVTVSIGADYFVKCSIKQAEILKQHRIKDAESKLDALNRERDLLQNKVSFTNKNIYEDQGHEIVEVYDEEEDKLWREQHKENLRQYKQGRTKEERKTENEVSEDELWNKLEELELQEEMENELQTMLNESNDFASDELLKPDTCAVNDANLKTSEKEESVEILENEINKKELLRAPKQISKLDLLQKVIDKQIELENKLIELKNKKQNQSKTEMELITKLDEIEELENLEDEMDRLDDVLNSHDAEEPEEEDNIFSSAPKIKRRVSFADEDDGVTLEISFKHSDVEPKKEPYDANKGILKPSDIYEAYSHSFRSETTPILKKANKNYTLNNTYEISKHLDNTIEDLPEIKKSIMVKDVIEKEDHDQKNKEITGARPTSLFKLRRQNKNK